MFLFVLYYIHKLNAQEKKMRQVSIKTLKNNIKDKPEQIALLLRTLPYQIGVEYRTFNNKKVIEGLKKRYEMVKKLSLQQ